MKSFKAYMSLTRFLKKGLVHVSLIILGSILLPLSVLANPQQGQVAAGSATISQSGGTTQITQSTNRAVINWQSYNVAANEQVNYQQPAASSITLNRINPQQGASQIYGKITANGQVWLVNPAGIWIAPGAFINVGGLLATTANITNTDFMAGNFKFTSEAGWNGAIINEGTIKIAEAGLLALVGNGVVNNGLIEANLSQVVIGGASEYTLQFSGNNLISFQIDKGVTEQAIDQNNQVLAEAVRVGGEIKASGGKVLITSKAASDILDGMINMDGVIAADTVGVKKGEIILMASNSQTNVTGKIYARGDDANERGGHVEVLGERVAVTHEAVIDVSGDVGGGEVLIGGDYQGKNESIQNAERTLIGPSTMIIADALSDGNGGKVIVWADSDTTFNGKIFARGGELGGNGGFVETSGKEYLNIQIGHVDASAKNGTSGIWLLDPPNVTITTITDKGSFDGGDPNTFTPSGNNAKVDVTTINGSLDTGTSVTITTGTTGGQPGNITVDEPILKSLGVDNLTLTLDAAGAILVDDNITATSGSLNVVFIGDSVTIGNSSDASITTNGGDFTATTQDGFDISSGPNVGSISVGSGKVVINANQDGSGNSNFSMNSGSSITSSRATADAVTIQVNTSSGGSGSATVGNVTVGNGGTITVKTDTGGNTSGGDINYGFGTLSAGANGVVTLSSPQQTNVNIGTSGSPLQFLAGTLNAITGSSGIFITNTGSGSLSLGTITTTGDFALTSTSSSAITDSGTLTIGGTMTITAGTSQNVTLDTASNDFGTVAIASANNVAVTDTNGIDIGTSTVSGTLDITANGNITQSGAATVTGKTTLGAGSTHDITLTNASNNFGTVAVTSGNDVTLHDSNAIDIGTSTVTDDFIITANGEVMQSGAITSKTLSVKTQNDTPQNITLTNSSNNVDTVNLQTRNLADTTDVAGVIHYTDADGFDIAALKTTDDAILVAGGAITQSGAVVIGDQLTLTAVGGINLNNSSNQINNFSASNSSSGNITLVNTANPLTLTSFSQNGGDVSISNTGTLAINDGVSLNSSNGNINITATDLNLNNTATINSGTGNLSITQNTDSGSIGIGTTGTMSISAGELSRISTANLTVNAPNNGSIVVDSISAADSTNLLGTTSLLATTGTLGTITFQGGSSTFKALTANANNGVTINTNLSTSVGAMSINGDANQAIGTQDGIVASAVNITSAGLLTLAATNGGVTLNGTTNLTGNGITVNAAINGNQNLTLNALSGNIEFNANVGNTNKLASITIINANNVTSSASINTDAYTQNSSGTTRMTSGTLTVSGIANITANIFNANVNVGELFIGINRGNLFGDVTDRGGLGGAKLIKLLKPILVNTIFFDNIDLYLLNAPIARQVTYEPAPLVASLIDWTSTEEMVEILDEESGCMKLGANILMCNFIDLSQGVSDF